MKTKAMLSAIVLFGLMLSSCNEKDAILVNRRTATPERVEEIKKAQKAKAEAQADRVRKFMKEKGWKWLESDKGREWLESPDGWVWLNLSGDNDDGWAWLSSSFGGC